MVWTLLLFVVQSLYAVINHNVIFCFPRYHVQTQRPKPDVSESVERTLCVVIAVLIFRHPTGFHTLVGLSSRLKSKTDFLVSQRPLILFSQKSAGLTIGPFLLNSDNQITLKL